MATASQPTYTPEEYLALERRAEYKSEYVNGRVYAMSGASRAHGRISLNIASELRSRFRGRPCEVYVNEMRVKVSPTGMYTYPDVAALCGAPAFEDAAVDTLLNPSVVFEVLSESTERYDRREKFAHCRRLPSLLEYVLVSQDRAAVEHFARRGEQWVLTAVEGLDATLALPALGCELPMAELYDRVAPFADAPPRGGRPRLGPHRRGAMRHSSPWSVTT
jgi:Uma2 family endonuclease